MFSGYRPAADHSPDSMRNQVPWKKNVNIHKKVLTLLSRCFLLELLAATDE